MAKLGVRAEDAEAVLLTREGELWQSCIRVLTLQRPVLLTREGELWQSMSGLRASSLGSC